MKPRVLIFDGENVLSCTQPHVAHVNFLLTSSNVTLDLPDVETSALDLLPVISSASDHTVSIKVASYFIFLSGKDVVRIVSKKDSDTSMLQALSPESLKFVLHPLE